jgi:hypothetical protein
VAAFSPEAAPNKPVAEAGADDAGGLLRPAKRLEPPVEGVVEPDVGFGVPKRLPAGGADDVGCDVGVLLWKLNVGCGGLDAVAGVAAPPEVAGVEPMLLNRLLDPVGFGPNRLPESAEELANGEAVLAGVCAGSEGLDAPNSGVCEPVEPKRLPPAGFEVLSEGGGPAGVVEVPKLENGLLGAGVVEPAGAEVEAVVDELAPPKIFCPAGLFRFPNKLGVAVPPVLLSLFAPGVDAPPSSFFCPNVKAAPKEGVDWPVPPNSEPVPPVVLAGFPNAPAVGAFPVLLPKSDGVDVPEPGLDPVVAPEKKDGAGGFPVLEVLLRLAKRPLVDGCDVAGVDWPKGEEVPDPKSPPVFGWPELDADPFEAPFPVPFCPPLPLAAPKVNGLDISMGCGGVRALLNC